MIHYKERIKVFQKNTGEWTITTDYQDQWLMSTITDGRTMITDWWTNQHQSDLRDWQKDMVISYAGLSFKIQLFNIYKKGGGFKQQHDMCIAHNQQHNIWIFSTQKDYWIVKTDKQNEVIFERKNSLGSVLDQDTRFQLGEIWDKMKNHYNPENYCQWIRY